MKKRLKKAYRSVMKVAILGLLGALLLTGCGSMSSLEDHASLIEYEACLEKQEKIQQEIEQLFGELVTDINARGESIIKRGEPDPKTGLMPSLETMIERCSKYRP
jgi:hypothetical protein